MTQDLQSLALANSCYMALSQYRRQRQRNKRYCYGDQWGDIIDVDGRRMSEEEYIKEQGSVPLKNNLIRRLVRNVIGVHAKNAPDIVCQCDDDPKLARRLTAMLRATAEANRLPELHARSLEEFLISGMAAHRKWYGIRAGQRGCWTDHVQPNSLLLDTRMRDFRGWDCRCVGELHDATFDEVLAQFAATPAIAAELRDIYQPDQGTGLCRVIELWQLRTTPRYLCHDRMRGGAWHAGADALAEAARANAERALSGLPGIDIALDPVQEWRYQFLAPTGHVLAQGTTPYRHGGHPYAVKAYPLIDGEIHSFVADVIDQQRYTNRLITMYDWMVRASAKGVLLIPEDCIPHGCDFNEYVQMWSRQNGVMVYRPSMRGEAPRQVTGNSANAGISELLSMQLKFFEDISGVNGALQGKLSNSAMSAELYEQQTQNATTSLTDVLNTYRELLLEGARKDLSNLMQQNAIDANVRVAFSDS